MSGAREGGCLCGAVRYRVTAEPLGFYVCHCTDCQRHYGTAFGLSMILPKDAVELVQGDPDRFRLTLPDGRERRGRHCAACVTRLWGEPSKFPQVRILRAGTLDDPRAYAPYGDIWTASALPWVRFTDGPQFEGQPEDPLALVRAWQERPRGAA